MRLGYKASECRVRNGRKTLICKSVGENDYFQTRYPNIYACGDVAEAAYHAPHESQEKILVPWTALVGLSPTWAILSLKREGPSLWKAVGHIDPDDKVGGFLGKAESDKRLDKQALADADSGGELEGVEIDTRTGDFTLIQGRSPHSGAN